MGISLEEFIKTYTGKPNVGNTPQNKGQCVGLVSVWMDTFGIPHEYGNAKDLLADANLQYVDVIKNTKTNVPLPGDIVVFDATPSNEYGHTSIFVSGDVNKFRSFDQNYPLGWLPHMQIHNYIGVLGWLHIKQQDPIVTPKPDEEVQDDVITDQTKIPQIDNKEVQAIRSTLNDQERTITDLSQKVDSITIEMGTKDKRIAELTDALAKAQQPLGDWSEQAVKAAHERDDIKKKYDELQKDKETTVQLLQEQCQGQLQSKDAEILDLEQKLGAKKSINRFSFGELLQELLQRFRR